MWKVAELVNGAEIKAEVPLVKRILGTFTAVLCCLSHTEDTVPLSKSPITAVNTWGFQDRCSDQIMCPRSIRGLAV